MKFEKRISKTDGYGIFTEKFIPKNTIFYRIPLDTVYSVPQARCARIAESKYVFDDEVLNWVNHSCNPNSQLDIDRSDPVLIAVRDILPNEEITVDYNETEMQGIRARCFCKSGKCKEYFNKL